MIVIGAVVGGAAALVGCSSTRIALAEQFGYAKREQLVSRVEEARDGQEAAKEQFESALAEFIAVTGATDAELEGKYNRLKKELEREGYAFRTSTDTEVVLAAYDRWGPQCLERFNGMWAFEL